MKKKKIRDIEQLKKNGWDFDQADLDSVSKRKSEIDLTKNIEGLSERIVQMIDAQKEQGGSIEQALTVNSKIMASGFSDLKEILSEPKNWEFEIRRNQKGFISKVFARQTG